MSRRNNEPVRFSCVTPNELALDIKVSEERDKHGNLKLNRNGRVHFWHESETILSDLTRRMNGVSRPYTFYRKEILPTLTEELSLEGDVKFRWSAYAGCWCPCSPGFICDARQLRGLNVSVFIKTI